MKVTLMGIQDVDFTNKETGERITGSKLHVVSETVENDKGMQGRRTAAIFTTIVLPPLEVGKKVDLVYEQILGSKNSRLVNIVPVS